MEVAQGIHRLGPWAGNGAGRKGRRKMRKLTKLLVVFAMVLTASGATAATAAKPPPIPPTITIEDPTAVCRSNGTGAFDLELTSGDITISDGAVLSSFNLDAARIGEVTSLLYPQTVRESWYYSWWGGSGDVVPPLPYTLNTADSWGGSWSGHQLGEPVSETVVYTNYWEVGVWAEAVATQGKGRGGQQQARAWEGRNWYFECTANGQVPALTESPQFTWCWEDDYTHATLGDGLWTWDGDIYVPCTLP